LTHPAVPIAKRRNRVCKSFVRYGCFRVFSPIPDLLTLSANIGTKAGVFPFANERNTTALAKAEFALTTVSA